MSEATAATATPSSSSGFKIDWRKAESRQPTRWAPLKVRTYLPGIPPFIPTPVPQSDDNIDMVELLDSICIRVRLDELQSLITNNDLQLGDKTVRKSDEQEPQYDGKGQRTNTKEKQASDKQLWERQRLIRTALSIDPNFRPPRDYRVMEETFKKKFFIPSKEYPDYNFVGLVLGPRGMTQKQMEKDTGAKIAIRGQGSIKTGKLGAGSKVDALHVLVTAPTLDKLRKAESLIVKLLIPMEEGRNTHKRAQLRKLAEFNGTLRHQFVEEDAMRKRAKTGCVNCGSGEHRTYNCAYRGQNLKVHIESQISLRDFFQSKFEEFCGSIDEPVPNKVDAATEVDTDDAYAKYMAEIAAGK